jgi:phosphatidylglycerophosphatase A
MISIKPLPGTMTMKDPAALIATGLGLGRLYPAPGTWGTLVAWLMGLLMTKPVLIVAFIAACAAGLWAAKEFEKADNGHDNGMIVIDEWAGIWLTMMFASFWDQAILAFVLFRFFDVLKPWPIRWLDKNVPGAAGVMVDDLAAGLAAGVLVYGYGLWIG